MARLSINELTTFRWTFEEDVDSYLGAEIPGIGVWRRKVADFGEEKACELLAHRGLKVSNLLWAGGFTGSDGRSFRDSVDDALDAVRLAAAMQAECLVVYSGARAGHTHNHARRLLREALKELLPAAEAEQVTLAVEPVHRGCASDFSFLTGLDDGLELLRQFNHPRLKLVFDTYHLGFDESVVSRVASIVSDIAVVHLGDGKMPPTGDQNRCRLGEGQVPLRQLVGALRQAGYDGWFDIELIGEDVESADYHELVLHSRDAFTRLLGC
jgi:sugar phosphate isomerase/epimerase